MSEILSQISKFDPKNLYNKFGVVDFFINVDVVYCNWCIIKIVSMIDSCESGVVSIII